MELIAHETMDLVMVADKGCMTLARKPISKKQEGSSKTDPRIGEGG